MGTKRKTYDFGDVIERRNSTMGDTEGQEGNGRKGRSRPKSR